MKYTNQISNEFAPLLEVCHILADEKKNTCEQVKKLLYSSGVLRGRYPGLVVYSVCLKY